MARQNDDSDLRGERGYTLVEVLVSVLVTVVLTFVVLAAVRTFAGTMRQEHASQTASSNADELIAQLRRDANSAFGVYVPDDTACNGGTSARADFYHKTNSGDQSGAGTTVSYVFANGSLTRTVSGGASTSTPLQSFSAQCIRPGTLNASYPTELGPLEGAKRIDNPVSGDPQQPGADGVVPIGGNRIVEVAFANTYVARTVRLMAGAAATGFSVNGPQWHSIVYTEGHTRRFLFGFGQISWIQIFAHIDVSWDDWQTKKTWCDWEALERYGPHPKFDKSEVPNVNSGNGPFNRINTELDPTYFNLPSLKPSLLLDYCRHNPGAAGSTTGTADPPGVNGGPTGATQPPSDSANVNLPAWWTWQNCNYARPTDPGFDGSGCNTTTLSYTCDPNTVGGCTYTISGTPMPATPPQGWTAWCAAYSSAAHNFGAPCAPPVPPPSNPPGTGCHSIKCCGGYQPPGNGPIAQSITRSTKTQLLDGNPIDPCCVLDGTCDPSNPPTDPGGGSSPSPSPAPTTAASPPAAPPFASSTAWLADCDASYSGTPADALGAPTDLASYTWNGSTYGTTMGTSSISVLSPAGDYLYSYESTDTGQTDGFGNEVYTSGYACVQRTS